MTEGFFAHEGGAGASGTPPFVGWRLVYAHGNAEYGHTQAEKVAQQLVTTSRRGLPGVEVLASAAAHSEVARPHALAARCARRTRSSCGSSVGGWTMDIDPSSIA